MYVAVGEKVSEADEAAIGADVQDPVVVVVTSRPILERFDHRPLLQALSEYQARVIVAAIPYDLARAVEAETSGSSDLLGRLDSARESLLEVLTVALRAAKRGRVCVVAMNEMGAWVTRGVEERHIGLSGVSVLSITGNERESGVDAHVMLDWTAPSQSRIGLERFQMSGWETVLSIRPHVGSGRRSRHATAGGESVHDLLQRCGTGWHIVALEALRQAADDVPFVPEGDWNADEGAMRGNGRVLFSDERGVVVASRHGRVVMLGGRLVESVKSVCVVVREQSKSPSASARRSVTIMLLDPPGCWYLEERGGNWSRLAGLVVPDGVGRGARSSWRVQVRKGSADVQFEAIIGVPLEWEADAVVSVDCAVDATGDALNALIEK